MAMFNRTLDYLVIVFLVLYMSCDSGDEDSNAEVCPCLEDLQLIGSHNSYKKAVEQPLLDYVTAVVGQSLSESLEYEHVSFEDQLDLGIRCLELDVFNDPEGGYYANPQGLDIISDAGHSPLPYDEDDKLELPGLKLFHVQDVDFRSHHLLFRDGLQALSEWSDENPDHLVIFVLIEAKDEEIDMTISPLEFTSEALASIDTEIRTVFANDELITPDQVRGNFETLEHAILQNGWPSIAQTNGKFLFVLDGGLVKTERYLQQFPGLINSSLFVNLPVGRPEAAFMIVNDPVTDFEHIQSLVSKGYLVRTLADSETREARINDFNRFEMAKASHAQIISTDYYLPSKLFNSNYQIIFEDGSYYGIQ